LANSGFICIGIGGVLRNESGDQGRGFSGVHITIVEFHFPRIVFYGVGPGFMGSFILTITLAIAVLSLNLKVVKPWIFSRAKIADDQESYSKLCKNNLG